MPKQQPIFTFQQISQLISSNPNQIFIILFSSLYNLTQFSSTHPGGRQILLEFNGKNATEFFVDTGHLTKGNIVVTLAKYRVGKVEDKNNGQKEIKINQQNEQSKNIAKSQKYGKSKL